MSKKQRVRSISTRISIIAIVLVIFSTLLVGTISYFLYRSDTIKYNADKAIAIAQSVSNSIDTSKLKESLNNKDKDEYINFMQSSFNDIAKNNNLAYLYAVEKDYGQDVTYITTGLKPGDEWYGDFKTTQSTSLFSEELIQSLDTKNPVGSKPYVSEGYGTLVSGYAPIFDSNGEMLGVVGVDINISDVVANVNMFGLRIILIISVLSIVFAFILVRYFGKIIGKPIKNLSFASKKIAQGDLELNINVESNDEIGELAKDFISMIDSTKNQVKTLEQIANGDLTVEIIPRSENDDMSYSMLKMIQSLNSMFLNIDDSTLHVSSGAEQMADAAQLLAVNSVEQAEAVEKVGSFVSALNENTQKNIEMAKKTADFAETIQNNAETSSEKMHELMQAVVDISQASTAIENVINIIEDIAFQTNILALNAAVEAARAGESGKGFSVVAEEVRNLAGRSTIAAKDTGELIKNSIKKAELGANIAKQTDESLQKIVSEIKESSLLTDEISKFSQEQGEDIKKINSDIEHISEAVQNNSATSQQTAASSQSMNSQASILKDLLSNFKLKND